MYLKLTMVLSVLVLSVSLVSAAEKSNSELLQETEHLSSRVKEFGKSLGIEPSKALLSSTKNQPAKSMLWVWVQKFGVISTEPALRLHVKFDKETSAIPLARVGVYAAGGYDYYYRQGDVFASQDSVITVEFSRKTPAEKVSAILHEDLHFNINIRGAVDEAIVGALADLAAREFFLRIGDTEGVSHVNSYMPRFRKLSREINQLEKELTSFFQTHPADEEEIREKARQLARNSPVYNGGLISMNGNSLEAQFGHDLAYFKYYDFIISLSEIAPSLKTLIADLKKSPSDPNRVEEYLRELETKYKRPKP